MDSDPDDVVKIYSRVLSPDIEYKTLCITKSTTCKEVIRMLLSKFKLKHRDPNLFYLTIEVWIRKTGFPIRSVMLLDDKACPAQLQAVYPHHATKFTLQMRRGGLVKVHDSCLMSGTQYKSLLLSDRTTTDELLQIVLHCNSSTDSVSKFALYEVCPSKNYERKLQSSELPLQIQQEWPSEDLIFFQLKRASSPDDDDHLLQTRRNFPWTRMIDEETGNITFRYSFKEQEVITGNSGSSDSLSTVNTTTTTSSSNSSTLSSMASSDYENFFI